MTSPAFTVAVSEDFIDTIADRVAELVGAQLSTSSNSAGWMDVDAVARYLCTTPDAIRGIVKRRQIPFHRTPTGRLLFDCEEVDSWVRSNRDAQA